ncbi:hypothetical protein [Butyrivibrio proteoclasticus]|uniref:GT-D fold domain-containing protein n=1 Tax=Butyrivibrio proteoclasticus TaxID=43305 RepID=UPI000684F09D|nr:hypothetical protein [Butyrivibrio proteoclasticus]
MVSEKKMYYRYSLNDIKRTLYRKITHKKLEYSFYSNRKVLGIVEGNDLIAKAIESGQPYMVTRYGANEINLAIDSLVHKKIKSKHLVSMMDNAGFFPSKDDVAYRFGNLMAEASEKIDLTALFYSWGEEFFISKYAANTLLVNNRALEPYYNLDSPWSAALKGKKVLVIHPFDKTIEAQYKKRNELFPGSEILPDFELHTIKAVQTIAGTSDHRFSDWFEALEWMVEETKKVDYDVALIGCGAYGLPLAARIKEQGKIAIHMGGCTQILFGIKGARWDNHALVSKLYNDAWVRPSDEDKPQEFKIVENGCYW